jgi:hypothetical protein
VLPQILADGLDVDCQRVSVRFVTGKDADKIACKNEAPVQKEGASCGLRPCTVRRFVQHPRHKP